MSTLIPLQVLHSTLLCSRAPLRSYKTQHPQHLLLLCNRQKSSQRRQCVHDIKTSNKMIIFFFFTKREAENSFSFNCHTFFLSQVSEEERQKCNKPCVVVLAPEIDNKVPTEWKYQRHRPIV